MRDVLLVLLTGVLALAGTFVGAQVTRSAAREGIEQQIREGRRQALQAHLAELVADVREKIELSWFLIPAFSKMTTKDMTEYVDTDSGIEQRQREGRIKRHIAEVGLLVGDTELRSALLELETRLNEWGEKASGPVTEKRGRATVDDISKAFEHVRATQTALNGVQAQAAALLAVHLSPAAPKRRMVQRMRRHG